MNDTKNIDPVQDNNSEIPAKRKRGRPKGSVKKEDVIQSSNSTDESTPPKRKAGRPKKAVKAPPKRKSSYEIRMKHKAAVKKSRDTRAKNITIKKKEEEFKEYSKSHVTQNDVNGIAENINKLKEEYTADIETEVPDIAPTQEELDLEKSQFNFVETEEIKYQQREVVPEKPEPILFSAGNTPHNPIVIQKESDVYSFLNHMFGDETQYYLLSEQRLMFKTHIKAYVVEDNRTKFRYNIYFDTRKISSLLRYNY